MFCKKIGIISAEYKSVAIVKGKGKKPRGRKYSMERQVVMALTPKIFESGKNILELKKRGIPAIV